MSNKYYFANIYLVFVIYKYFSTFVSLQSIYYISKELKSITSEITPNDLSIIGITTALNGLTLAQNINFSLKTDLRLCKDFESYDKDKDKIFYFRCYYYSDKIHHLEYILISNKNDENQFLVKTHLKYDYLYVVIGRDNKFRSNSVIEKINEIHNIQLIRNVHPTPTTKEHFKQTQESESYDIFGNKVTSQSTPKKTPTKKQITGISIEQFIEDADYYLGNVMVNKRIFLAYNIMLSSQTLKSIDEIGVHFSKENIKLIPKENHHLTIQFVGDSSIKQINNVIDVGEEVFKKHNLMEIEINSFKFFSPSPKEMIIYLSLSENKTLEKINKAIKNRFLELNVNVSNLKFIPHITIAKLKDVKNHKDKINEINDLFNVFPQKIQLSSPILYESISIGNKVRYDIIKIFD